MIIDRSLLSDDTTDEEETVTEVPEVPLETNTAIEDTETGEPNYRYLCPACTGIAFYSKSKDAFVSVCRNCGKAMSERHEGNYIPLTESEKESLRAWHES